MNSRVKPARRAGDFLHARLRLARRVARDRDDARPEPRRRRLKLADRDVGVVALRGEDGEGLLAAREGVFGDPVGVGFDQERQEIDAGLGDALVSGEGDDRPPRRLGDARDFAHVAGEQRPENNLRAGADDGLRRLRGAIGRADDRRRSSSSRRSCRILRSASCAPLCIEAPMALGAPFCVSGRIRPILTGPVPTVSPTVGPLSGCD